MTHLKQMHEWLKTRAGNALHIHQLKSLIKIFQKMYKDFELQVTIVLNKMVLINCTKGCIKHTSRSVESGRTTINGKLPACFCFDLQ